jgi:hypothetical protein
MWGGGRPAGVEWGEGGGVTSYTSGQIDFLSFAFFVPCTLSVKAKSHKMHVTVLCTKQYSLTGTIQSYLDKCCFL